MTEQLLARAAAGDENAFRELTDPFRRELQLHCYRILGSMQDAEEALQETMLSAWRGLGRFEGRAPVRSWLYRIATNRCLNALRDAGRRPSQEVPMPAFQPPEPTRLAEPSWLEPYPDVLLDALPDAAPGPETRYETKEAVGLAFVTALQHLPPRQRAVLVLRDVLGFRAPEVAQMLESSEDSVKGALKRARATLESRLPSNGREGAPLPDSPAERELVRRFATAFTNGDTAGVLALLTDDAWVSMPPMPFEYNGLDAIGSFLDTAFGQIGSTPTRLVPTRANTQPAFGFYRGDPVTPLLRATGLFVLTLEGDRISALTRFESSVLPRFGLPRLLRGHGS
jgi:RNA polymerase sigma-70 factor (TIGR02960 family)